MEDEKISTREHLLNSAGELFAQDGFEAVTTRMIAELAGVKVSAIHYHFGKKEQLYIAALTRAVEADSCADFASVLNENPALLETPEGIAEAIRSTVFRSFHDHFKGENPDWMTQLITREVIRPSEMFQEFADSAIKPDSDAARELYQKVRPEADDIQAAAWLDILHSQIFLYIMARDALELMRGEGSMNMKFYRGVARVVARAMILELDLPLPPDLQ